VSVTVTSDMTALDELTDALPVMTTKVSVTPPIVNIALTGVE
jgi:hypothetical protein